MDSMTLSGRALKEIYLKEKFSEDKSRLKERRDVANFLRIRNAGPGDDIAIGDFLLKTFMSTYEKKLPSVTTTEERKRSLFDVTTKRRNGIVCLLELGYKIAGTFSLIHPDAEICESWIPNSANLRSVAVDPEYHGLGFSELLLGEAIRLANIWKMHHICLHVQKGADNVAKLYMSNGYQRDSSGDRLSDGQEIEAYFLPLKKDA